MNTLCLIRHSLTYANEHRLYCGHTDIPLSENGRKLALTLAEARSLPSFDGYASSGMKRAMETLALLTGKNEAEIIPNLMEMNFGAFEMMSYEQLKDDPAYIRWIEDKTGAIACPGGESRNVFHERVTACADTIINEDIPSLMIVCHGGVIANIMQHWFPGEDRHFYQWQPSACAGYMIQIENKKAISFEPV
ncbi:MAG: histidine phosphatase family protein [Clostridia bacterium]|nr:histidine phosphatase family protein [Clostridia bacterium]